MAKQYIYDIILKNGYEINGIHNDEPLSIDTVNDICLGLFNSGVKVLKYLGQVG